ncbi:hypothetical protein D3C80_1258530 [compost metagenome]
MRQRVPVLLRDQFVAALGAVGVSVDHARHDDLFGHVHALGCGGDVDLGTTPHGQDAVVLDQDDAVFDDAPVRRRHRDDARAHEGQRLARLHRLSDDGKRNPWGRLGLMLEDGLHVAREELRSHGPAQLRSVACPIQITPRLMAGLDARESGAGALQFERSRGIDEGRDAHGMVFLERHMIALWRHLEVLKQKTFGVKALVAPRPRHAVQSSGHSGRRREVDAIIGCREVRILPVRRQPRHRAAGRLHHENA